MFGITQDDIATQQAITLSGYTVTAAYDKLNAGTLEEPLRGILLRYEARQARMLKQCKLPAVDPMLLEQLRALRLQHWQKAMKFRKAQRNLEEFKSRSLKDCIKNYDKFVNEHLTAVQTLNEFFDIGDTAERDDANAAN